MLKGIKRFYLDESGATAIEYGLIAALVSTAAIAALTAMGNSLQLLFGSVANSMATAISSSSVKTKEDRHERTCSYAHRTSESSNG